jgi:hypothetical protein
VAFGRRVALEGWVAIIGMGGFWRDGWLRGMGGSMGMVGSRGMGGY